MIDLHTHSTASDGTLPARELVQAASQLGITTLALTDHDTIEGIEEARKEAAIQGIQFIPGIELEIEWAKSPTAKSPSDNSFADNSPADNSPAGEFHLLGLGISTLSPELLRGIAKLAQSRRTRNQEILDRADELGIKIDYQELLHIAGHSDKEQPAGMMASSIGRPHIAALLVQRGIVKDIAQAFDKYLGNGKPLYIPKKGLNIEEALGIIHAAQGIAVLAHPMSLYVSWRALPNLIATLASQGLDGIEAWHPNAKPGVCSRLEELGRSLGLIITAGSDYHGPSRADRNLGFTAGNRGIDDAYLPPQFR